MRISYVLVIQCQYSSDMFDNECFDTIKPTEVFIVIKFNITDDRKQINSDLSAFINSIKNIISNYKDFITSNRVISFRTLKSKMWYFTRLMKVWTPFRHTDRKSKSLEHESFFHWTFKNPLNSKKLSKLTALQVDTAFINPNKRWSM
jgi:hypothetical protein